VAPLPIQGYDGPPPLTGGRFLTAWQADPVILVVVLVTAAAYLWAGSRLRRRGDNWSVGRDVAFVGGGLGTIVLATQWWPGVYDDTLFWAHMVQHMALSMVAPIFLALGAPVTLALRTLRAGGRRRLTAVLRSLPARVLLNPLVGFALLFGTPFVLYFTGLYEATLRNDTLHAWLHVHFVVAGCVFFWPLVGTDPVPGRLPHPMRLLLLFVTLPAHAWLGISIMSNNTVIGGDFYRALGRPWGPSLLHDQSIGGGLLWATGDLVGLLVVAALFWQWARADDREAVRTDRDLDRRAASAVRSSPGPAGDEQGAWAAYNAHLAALADRDRT
jgi:cytochrome c oxidase assembly factor CtaG